MALASVHLVFMWLESVHIRGLSIHHGEESIHHVSLPSDPPLLPYPHQPTNLVQLGLLEWIRHAKFCTLQETSKSGGKMRNLLSETGNSKPCALRVCFCEECVEFVQRKNPKVQKWSCRFFPAIWTNEEKTGPARAGKVGNNGMGDMERKKQILLWACTGSSSDYIWWSNYILGRVSKANVS